MPVNRPTTHFSREILAIFIFGVVSVAVMLLIAIVYPAPTQFQQMVFRIVLALAAAGVGAVVPGFLNITYRNLLRAGGAMALFIVVYFFNPASYVTS